MTQPLNYRVTSPNPVFMLGDGVFVVPGIVPPDSPIFAAYIAAGQQITSYAASVVTKLVCEATTGTTNCTGTGGNCSHVPPYNDAVPSPATVFGTASAFSSVGAQTHQTEFDAMARINAAAVPTGFWLLQTTNGYLTIEVGYLDG